MESSKTYLEMAAKERAADIFLIAGRRVSFKRGDSLVPISDESLTPEHSAVLIREIYDMANRRFPEPIKAFARFAANPAQGQA